MQARIRVGSIHWVIVEQIEDPDTTHLLAEGGEMFQPLWIIKRTIRVPDQTPPTHSS